ncbi:MAG: glycosyltransferase family 2 protein [Verrucomicrobia bacterium]|nr:glycosyltransferase family 2 protein [Verrucomicrobiota bacterium]
MLGGKYSHNMKNTGLVSVAMATCNGEKFLEEQIRSILSQTHGQLELVISDDASTDGTLEIALGFQRDHSNVRVFSHDNNLGVTANFERAIGHCLGSHVAIADQDDVWKPEKIDRLLHAIGDADAAYSDSELINEMGNLTGKRFGDFTSMKTYRCGSPFLLSNCVPGHAMLVRKDALLRAMPFPRHIIYDKWISYCVAANNGLVYLNESLVLYRQHEGNMFGLNKGKERKRQTVLDRFEDRKSQVHSYLGADIIDRATKCDTELMALTFRKGFSIPRFIFY